MDVSIERETSKKKHTISDEEMYNRVVHSRMSIDKKQLILQEEAVKYFKNKSR